ncbi:helix-turn-helix domain-containing protein [Haloprofundus halobius]|uniref:helix-turn-helix domain-containing protein n=1 Tax=Haloprofundus halobius TaxID=2876194 RepID=UPI001CCD830E|nr:helix-turn-helix domain-containing protein [Haloprofundus halobius]
MGTGIHAQVTVEGVVGCPAAAMSETVDVESIVVDRQTAAAGGGVVGELTVERPVGEESIADESTAESTPDRIERVFADDERSVYRFVTESGDCPCGHIPDHDCPLREVRADAGALSLSFIAPDVETLRSILADLQSCSTAVRVQRLTQSTPNDEQRLLFVDREAFTDRQYEVLRTAHEMGYFARPKRADSAAVAAELDISVATFSEHLAVTQEKLLDQLLAV